jgi:hypothetical protein
MSDIKNIISKRPQDIIYSLISFIIIFLTSTVSNLLNIEPNAEFRIPYFYYLGVVTIISFFSCFFLFKGRPSAKVPICILLLIFSMTSLLGIQQSNPAEFIILAVISIAFALICTYFLVSAQTFVWLKACKLARKGKLPEDYQEQFFQPQESNNQIRPWIRYFARRIDVIFFLFIIFVGVMIISLFIGFILGVLDGAGMVNATALKFNWNNLTNSGLGYFLIILVVLFCFVILEAIFLKTWGTTPGKWLLQIKIRDSLGRKPSFYNALRRSVRVYVQGMWLAMPGISIIPLLISYHKLVKNKITPWDKDYQFIVSHENISFIRVGIAIIILALLCGFIYALSLNLL